jgi:hypothetical protein
MVLSVEPGYMGRSPITLALITPFCEIAVVGYSTICTLCSQLALYTFCGHPRRCRRCSNSTFDSSIFVSPSRILVIGGVPWVPKQQPGSSNLERAIMSTTPPLSQAFGYGIVIGLGFAFSYVLYLAHLWKELSRTQLWHDPDYLCPQKVCKAAQKRQYPFISFLVTTSMSQSSGNAFTQKPAPVSLYHN